MTAPSAFHDIFAIPAPSIDPSRLKGDRLVSGWKAARRLSPQFPPFRSGSDRLESKRCAFQSDGVLTARQNGALGKLAWRGNYGCGQADFLHRFDIVVVAVVPAIAASLS
jgi:hypothetical protein